ncbi:DUF4079 domain-containing protein [Synechococcus sp. R55.6]|jgi:hypothetical protein|uniref:DUF4079 domain-containing protein n=1 Tax=unclassified Synechococcus TaxID=2626047 RepID=UPI0039C39E2B
MNLLSLALPDLSAASDRLTAALQPVAQFFAGLNLPQPIVQWGHPLMMGIVVVVMGSFVGLTGWRGRTLRLAAASPTSEGSLPESAQKPLLDHRKLAPWMATFIALGYTGGILSLVMQGKPLLSSPHFWTGSLVLLLLAVNGALSLSGFGGNRAALRTTHAYVGSLILCILFAHALFGLKLGLSL